MLSLTNYYLKLLEHQCYTFTFYLHKLITYFLSKGAVRRKLKITGTIHFCMRSNISWTCLEHLFAPIDFCIFLSFCQIMWDPTRTNLFTAKCSCNILYMLVALMSKVASIKIPVPDQILHSCTDVIFKVVRTIQ